MRQVDFQEVGMENYGLYITPMILEFKKDTLILITGPNGIGKTMSLDALPFTLYGITSKGAKGDDVVNNTVGKNCKTWVKFQVNNDQYLVTRYHKHSKGGSTVILNKNGVDIKKGQREVSIEIERIICPRKTFMNTLMFGQKVKDFFTDLGDADKKEIFRRILDLDVYSSYYDETKKMIEKLESGRREIDKKLAVTNGILNETRMQMSILLKQKAEFETNKNERIQVIKKSIDDNIRLLEKWQITFEDIKEKIVDISEVEKKLNEALIKLGEVKQYELSCQNELNQKKNKKISEIKEKANESLQNIKDILQSKLTNLRDQIQASKDSLVIEDKKIENQKNEIRINFAEFKSEKVNIQNQIKEIKENVLDKDIASCPVCKQDVTDEVKADLSKKVSDLSARLNHIVSVIEVELKKEDAILDAIFKENNRTCALDVSNINVIIKKEQDDSKNEEDGVKTKLAAMLKLIDDYARKEEETLVSKCKEDLGNIVQELASLKLQHEAQNDLKNKHNEIERTITNIKNQNKVYEAEIQTIEKQEFDMRQMGASQGKIFEMEHQLEQGAKALTELNKMQDVVEFWKSGFSSTGIPSMLIDEAVPFMNQRVTYYLDLITNGRYIVSFDTMAETKAGEFRDKIAVRVVDTHTRANSRVQLSGGQTRIIDIATILTLGDLQASIQDVKFNILLFDEIFDSLDEENIGYVSKILPKLKINRSIYIISHTHQEQVEADEVLAFR
jgi:DNA repair exonuclease SbcCD ATPase subunit